MRHSHVANPFHRIECWTGTFFRQAHLWEVGVYILVPHQSKATSCATLHFQINALEQIQLFTDEEEQLALHAARGLMSPAIPSHNSDSNRMTAISIADEYDESDEEDEIYELEENEDNHLPHYLSLAPMHADEVPNVEVPLQQVPEQQVPDHENPRPSLPRHDALNNHYVRIIHSNGIHDLAIVTCQCLGADAVHADLIFCKLIPASFSTYKTLFTIDALDDFRLSNLECKASAYQYFQKLRRLTAPTAPANAPNFYQELLRVSRLWRWLKKKKWAGHGHTLHTASQPAHAHSSHRGSQPPPLLANFCPACPQPGLNLPDNWESDPKR